MNPLIKLVITIGIFAIPPFLFAKLILRPNIDRKVFSLLASLLMGLQLFTLVVLYVDLKAIIVGFLLLFFSIIVGFPIAYLLYPRLKSRVENYAKKE
jgi:hypothetical protein